MTDFVPRARLTRIGPIPTPIDALGGARIDIAAVAALGAKLSSYDVIAVSMSGGKDSQAALHVTCEAAARAGVLDRVVALHADLGPDEWPDAQSFARAQAAMYGRRFVVTSRIGREKTRAGGALYDVGEVFGDLHDYARRRRERQGLERAWQRQDARWCTSEFKRTPLNNAAAAELARWRRAEGGTKRRARILSVRGLRADESTARAELAPFSHDRRFTSSRRWMDVWLPVHSWTTRDVWATIRDTGQPYHWAYDLGMPRLSCAFCMLAGRGPLVLAGHFNRPWLVQKVKFEAELGEPFKKDLALATVLEAVDAGEWPEVASWAG